MGRLANVLARIDDANRADPHRVIVDGVERPKELVYAERMSVWLAKLAPGASEALQIAARGHHVRRWEIPRSKYPMDRQGYKTWRTELGKFHAATASEMARAEGYDAHKAARIGALIRKEKLKTDPEAQLLEDVACLVFLEHYFWDFAVRQEPTALNRIIEKTWIKMSPRARAEALRLPLPAEAKALLENVLL